MDREVKDRTILDEFAIDFTNTVKKHARYIIVSGFVAIAHGRSRGTEDIDIIIERVQEEEFSKLHKDLVKHDFECIQSNDSNEIFGYLKDNLSVRYIRRGTHIPEMEVKFSKDKIDDFQIETRKKLPLTGLDLYFSSIETNIAFKEELLKSEKDIEDAKHLRIVYGGQLNEYEIERVKILIKELRLK